MMRKKDFSKMIFFHYLIITILAIALAVIAIIEKALDLLNVN